MQIMQMKMKKMMPLISSSLSSPLGEGAFFLRCYLGYPQQKLIKRGLGFGKYGVFNIIRWSLHVLFLMVVISWELELMKAHKPSSVGHLVHPGTRWHLDLM